MNLGDYLQPVGILFLMGLCLKLVNGMSKRLNGKVDETTLHYIVKDTRMMFNVLDKKIDKIEGKIDTIMGVRDERPDAK